MSNGDIQDPEGVIQPLAQPTIRVVLALAILFGLQVALSIIPGVGTVVLQPDVTVGTVLYGAITLVMFGAVFNYGDTVGDVLNQSLPNVPEIQRIVRLVTVLLITIWAYQVFWWLPYFRSNPGQYDLLFLLLGIGVTGWLAYLLYTNVDELSELATGKLVDATSTDVGISDVGGEDGSETGVDNPTDEDISAEAKESRTNAGDSSESASGTQSNQ